MTDKIKKNLSKFSKKERGQVKNIILAINTEQTKGLNIAKLKGSTDTFRAKKGRIRIIYRKDSSQFDILSISKRNEKTYKDF